MGCCCSCLSSDAGSDNQAGDGAKEMELQAQKAKQALDVSAKMSAPTITRKAAGIITGHGLALIGVPIEQDACYWEWHISDVPPNTTMDTILFGVSSKKDPTFYQGLNDKDVPEEVNGTPWMRRIDVENGDVIGVAVQQSDLPMVQFSLNGESLHISAINRFRGTVYPAIYLGLPAALSSASTEATTVEKEGGGKSNTSSSATSCTVTASLVVDEREFKYKSPGPRFGPVIVARSIV